MSTSDATGLIVADARDQLTEIEILDDRLQVVPLDANLGCAKARLSPGIYEVRFRAGPVDQFDSQDVVLFANTVEETTLATPLRIASAVPFEGTSTWNAVHSAEARRIAQGPPTITREGANSRLLLFIRDIKTDAPDIDLVRGLTLRDSRGELVFAISDIAARSQRQFCAGCLLELPEGDYRLRLTMGPNEHFERVLPLVSGWITQVFLFTRTHGGASERRFADFSTASLAFAPIDRPFQLTGDWFRPVELARHALEGDRARLGEDILDQLSRHTSDSPWLALCAAHLHLRRRQPDADRLHRLLSGIPLEWKKQSDFRILQAHVDLLKAGVVQDSEPIDSPPVLFASWSSLLKFPESARHLVVADSFVDRIADQIRRAGPWLVWRTEEDQSADQRAAPSVSFGNLTHAAAVNRIPSLQELSVAFSLLAGELQKSLPLMVRLAREDLSSLERRLAHLAVPLAVPGLRDLLPQYPQLARLMTWSPTSAELQQNLTVPLPTAWRGLQTLLAKLGLNVRSLRLQVLVDAGAIEPALRKCHTPCGRLIAFDDFVQEVLLRAVEHQEKFRGQSDAELLGWLQAIGRQQMANHLRSSRGMQVAPLPPEIPDSRQKPVPDQVAEAEMTSETEDEQLRRVMSTISLEERQLLTRLYLRGDKLQSVAQELGIPANTLAQRHARLMRRLKKDKI